MYGRQATWGLENQRALKAVVANTKINMMHAPRPGKKLCVLDLDRTLLHFTQRREVAVESIKRPYMDAFLVALYQKYDLVVWSQTSWRWVEVKLTELGMLTHAGYKICLTLDETAMFRVKCHSVK